MLHVSKLSLFNKAEFCKTKRVALAEEEKVNFKDWFFWIVQEELFSAWQINHASESHTLVWYAGKGSQLCEIKTCNLGTSY